MASVALAVHGKLVFESTLPTLLFWFFLCLSFYSAVKLGFSILALLLLF